MSPELTKRRVDGTEKGPLEEDLSERGLVGKEGYRKRGLSLKEGYQKERAAGKRGLSEKRTVEKDGCRKIELPKKWSDKWL